jgi:ribosomal protein S18 acetylase RimI-like enzyme
VAGRLKFDSYEWSGRWERIRNTPAIARSGDAIPSAVLHRSERGRAVQSNASPKLIDLVGIDRERAVPVVRDGFEGIYRWHAKRTLRDIERVRALEAEGEIVGVSMLERLLPEVGYVYYIAVLTPWRRRGQASRLLDDALAWFSVSGARVVYAAAEEDNTASLALFNSRGFRVVERDEPKFRDGGLGAWGLRSRMRIVYGEVLMGLRLRPEPPAESTPSSG